MRYLGLLSLMATVVWVQPGATSNRSAHAVTLHLTAFTRESVTVHLVSKPAGLTLSADTIARVVDSLTLRTPADVRVEAGVQRLQLWTEGNRAIRVTFATGASEKERALAPWGRRLTFIRRPDGDLRPVPEVLPAQSPISD
jgi:hypothetical protein